MNPKQWQWLTKAANQVPRLFAELESETSKEETISGVNMESRGALLDVEFSVCTAKVSH